MALELRRALNGAVAGAVSAKVWALQQRLDKRAFGTRYDDVELLGKMVTRGAGWPLAGFAMHAANGVAFGATYAILRPRIPGPPLALALGVVMAENFGFWPLGRLVDRHHQGAAGARTAGGQRARARGRDVAARAVRSAAGRTGAAPQRARWRARRRDCIVAASPKDQTGRPLR